MKINKRTRVWPIFYIKAETGLVKEAIFGRTEVLNKKSYTKYIGSFRWLRKRWIVRWNGPSRPFSFIFGLFKQTMQQIYVKIAHPEWSGSKPTTSSLMTTRAPIMFVFLLTFLFLLSVPNNFYSMRIPNSPSCRILHLLTFDVLKIESYTGLSFHKKNTKFEFICHTVAANI